MWERFKDVYRKMDVTYIVGPTRVGKSRYVMEKYGYTNVYRISDYTHPFDEYNYQDVVVFDEFRSSLRLTACLPLPPLHSVPLVLQEGETPSLTPPLGADATSFCKPKIHPLPLR